MEVRVLFCKVEDLYKRSLLRIAIKQFLVYIGLCNIFRLHLSYYPNPKIA